MGVPAAVEGDWQIHFLILMGYIVWGDWTPIRPCTDIIVAVVVVFSAFVSGGIFMPQKVDYCWRQGDLPDLIIFGFWFEFQALPFDTLQGIPHDKSHSFPINILPP